MIPSHTCACGRDASLGRRTCARCRVVRLAARLTPGLDLSSLAEAPARDVERSLLDAEAALDRARARAAVALGHATVDHPVAGEEDAVRCTFRAPADDARARWARAWMPGIEVARG